ncbi:MAG TPA: hypothetical protein VGO29_08920 [Solirubrobacteraceae bacterium]|jgi:hypothetical protein|nr:hypothetical protein [Solirubrobacteraceae bacterium]
MRNNPFNVTKAVDFSDEQIARTWVDFASDNGGFFAIADPTSPMPRILLGGKGSGRTHLMRYYSARLQRLRGATSSPKTEGYIGIYLRCSGLNAGRFGGKGIEPEAWQALFVYYMDLWLAQLAISTVVETFGEMPELIAQEDAIARLVAHAFDDFGGELPSTLLGLETRLHGWQRELDLVINNAAITRRLDAIQIRAARGRLPLAVPKAFAACVPDLSEIIWLYLLDELENLTDEQQRYVQTLIREKEPPASFMVGSRLYGFRTTRTLSADEENKEGSEFEPLRLDRFYLTHESEFAEFCRRVIAQRLIEEGAVPGQRDAVAEQLDGFFVTDGERDTSFVTEEGAERKYFAVLARQLETHQGLSESEAAKVIALLEVPSKPLLEKLNTLLLYQRWNTRTSMHSEAGRISKLCAAWRDGKATGHYGQKVKHHEPDMYAQLLRQYSRQRRYLGLETFITMAGGLPRNLLIILKNVYRWAEFNGEQPFHGVPISIAAQRDGVQEASSWFLKDNLPLGVEGENVERAVSRLGALLRALHFADRPPEIRMTTFSVDPSRLSLAARESLRDAERASMLLTEDRGHRDKNDASVTVKYRLNPMLCPYFDLPLTVGGTLKLSTGEANAVFGEKAPEEFDRIRRARVRRANVPFRAHRAGEQIDLLSDVG